MKNTYIRDIEEGEELKKYDILGWITRKRTHGGVTFIDLTDSTGTIQAIATKEYMNNGAYDKLKSLKEESAVYVSGTSKNNKGKMELDISALEVKAESTIDISPSPRNVENPFDPKYIEQIVKHPSFYLRNPKIAAALKIKSLFKRNLEEYFWDKDFVQFEPPTLTLQTLYSDEGAIWVDVHGQKMSLSRCATFHLEPALMAYEKVFAITTSFANEMSRSDRHLAEYTHLKAELAWTNLEELMDLAGQMYYDVAKKTIEESSREIKILGLETIIKERVEKINPKNNKIITYDDAVELLQKKGIDIEYGKSLSSSDEKIITKHYDENFVWIKHVPCSAEGFPFKKKKDAPHLTMTCDLIAPSGYGEILGTAEKITDKNELIERMEEKGKTTPEQITRYKDYIELRDYGLPEHGGIGMGIERGVRYLLDLPHVRFTRPFPVLHGTRVTF